MKKEIKTQLVVLGSGPGGYTAAFRAADLGKSVVLVEREPTLGGVCLNVGCIPSKALLHAAKVIDEAEEMRAHGIEFGAPSINTEKLLGWKNGLVKSLTSGLKMLATQRKVQVIHGAAQFTGSHEISVDDGSTISFENAIIAVGSEPVRLPFLPEDPRIIDSTGALTLKNPKGSMLIIGGGIIGLEMACVYSALGAEISVVELMDTIIPGCDKDISAPLHKRISKRYKNIFLKTKVTAVEAKKDGIWVTFEGENAPKEPQRFDQVLVAVGRKPNVIAGKKHYFDPKCIPSVAYTDPEIAWVGLTEIEAKAKGIAYGKGSFPWAASGRSLSIGRNEGITKLLFHEKTHRLIGASIVGTNAGELIAEMALAIEMGCDARDIALTIHPHPTLSETIAFAAEVFEGTITDLYLPKKK
jgi:dihydrolipoamide dehydrogenase